MADPNMYRGQYGQGSPHQQQGGYGPPQGQQYGYGTPPPPQGGGPYGPPQGQPQFGHGTPPPPQGGAYGPPQDGGQMGGLASQMGGMDINPGGDSAGAPAPHRAGKKKNRHAYHNIEMSSQAQQGFQGGAGMGGPPPPGQQFSQGQFSPGLQQGGQFGGSPPPGQQGAVTPAMNQFPAAGGAYMPGSRPHGPGGPPPPDPGASTGVTAQGKVDPEQIPSVPRSRDAPAQHYLTNTYATMEQHLPPPAAIPYTVYDQGNSSPKYARLTLNDIPSTSEALGGTALPLGLISQPLAPLSAGEYPIPVLDFGDTGPPRCRRCRAYINPFMVFRGGGNKFVCNMCTFPNDVPPEYFAPTDMSGVRVDRDQRPELKLGTVEFMVPKEYWAKEPIGLRHLFVIDVSAEAVQRGLLGAFCQAILEALYADVPEEDEDEENEEEEEKEKPRAIPPGAKVGFVTYDRDVHFYNCNASLDKAQMLVMAEVDDPFVPLGSDGLFVDPYESRKIITSLLTNIPNLFSEVRSPEPALLPALLSSMESLSLHGGKIICSLSTLPTYGPGKLFRREDKNMSGIETEKKLFQTEHPGWKRCAGKMVEGGIGVDFFIASPSGAYMDIATIGHVQAVSGGETFYYSNFHAERDYLRLYNDLKHIITRETGYQALLKVRCSNGLQVSAYLGNFQQHTFGADLEFGTVDADKAVGVMFSYDGKLDPKLDAHFQCALLYTTATGERRVRCTNTVASVSDGGANCMRYIDQDAVVSIIAKEASMRMTERTLKDVRNAITEKTIDILAGYRRSYSTSQPPGQLVLPENLKEFSMYTLGLIKSRAFKGGNEPSDRRTHTMRLIRGAGPLTVSLLLYPRIYSLHDLPPEAGFPDDGGNLVTPPALRASFARIQEGGAYLVSDGQTCLLWLHAQVSPNLLEDLFGPDVQSLQDLNPNLSALPVLDTHLNAQARNLLAYWGSIDNRGAPALQLARQGLDGSEYEFARLLVEDRNGDAQSYVDWLVHVHRGVQMEISGQRGRSAKEAQEQESTMAGLRAMGW